MFKFNGGKGAIVCDKCRVLIAENVAYTDRNQRYILCSGCRTMNSQNETEQQRHERLTRLLMQRSKDKMLSCMHFREMALLNLKQAIVSLNYARTLIEAMDQSGVLMLEEAKIEDLLEHINTAIDASTISSNKAEEFKVSLDAGMADIDSRISKLP